MDNDQSRPLSLALVRQKYSPFGGAERFLERAIQHLGQENLALTVLTRSWPAAATGQVAIRTCPAKTWGRWHRDWRFSRWVCQTVAREAFDLVQSHERIPCCDIFRAGDGVHREWLRQRARVHSPWDHWLTSLSPFHRRVLAAEAALFHSHRLRAVICNSTMVRDEIRTHYQVPARQLWVIPNGVDGTLFHPGLQVQHRREMRQSLAIPETAVVLLLVGSGYFRKGVDHLLKLFPLLPESVWLLVVGNERHLKRYRHRAAGHPSGERIRWLGPQQDVRPFYGTADLFVLPALYDPFPNAALEAMAAGLPVVVSTKCGTVDLIGQGQGGRVADALDQNAWLEHLHALLDPALRHALGIQARAMAMTLTLEQMTARLLELYRELLTQP
ncbi:MAG: glycosyltransferase family 4 protein [Magnetococcales bacterium]|nr:glycosyltransferase family 4 protein [Magnetococcales bacterium]